MFVLPLRRPGMGLMNREAVASATMLSNGSVHRGVDHLRSFAESCGWHGRYQSDHVDSLR